MSEFDKAIVEDAATEKIMDRVRKLLALAENQAGTPEAEAFNARAAELIAKYGIDRAMLAARGEREDRITDKVIPIVRPFQEQMMSLLWNITSRLGGNGRYIKTWNKESGPKARGGVPRGGWDYKLRVFAYESDLERIEVMYASARLQGLSGAKQIVDKSTEFGQSQKAERVSYLEGFAAGVSRQLADAERSAKAAAEAAEVERRDRLMLEGKVETGQPGVALVLADRKKSVEVAMDLAYGITVADQQRWADAAKKRQAEIADCKKCAKAKSGRCSDHKVRVGRIQYTQRSGSQWGTGYSDGQKAQLGTGRAVGNASRKEIG